MKQGEGTGAKRPTSQEHFKAKRLGQEAATRDVLRLRVHRAAAAAAFERATRSRIAADLDSARVLRRSVQAIWRENPADGDGSGFAMLLNTVLTAVAMAAHWHRTHQHAQQEAAAQQALVHLQIAYGQVAEPVLVGLAQRAPSAQTKRRFAQHLQQAAPEHVERILRDTSWDALATVLAEAEAAGHNAATVLDQALGQRTPDDAHSPARALTWRIRRLGERHAPGPRAQAARARSAVQRTAAPIHPAATPPPSPAPPARRR